jgi:two-component system phosphate regulon response regulator PhoB
MASQARRVVLVADDDPDQHRLIETTLGTRDFELLHAPDGRATLRAARERLPALVLLAVNLPGPDGFDVCRQLKDDPATASIKIVMLTERSSEGDRALGREAGADDYFVEPFSPVELLNTIYALLE